MKSLLAIVLLFCLSGAFSVSGQVPGSLDLSFDGDGKLSFPLGNANAFANSVAVQPDGKIVIACYASLTTLNDFTVVRLNPNGTPDLTFGNNGISMIDFSGDDDYANSIAIDPSNGKIIVGGYTDIGGDFDFAAARLLPDGTIDLSFGLNGRKTKHIGTTSFCTSMVLQNDGKIVLGGYSFFSGFNLFALLRINIDGSEDLSFNTTGVVLTNFNFNSATTGSLAIQPTDGKIILGGQVLNAITSRWDFALARYNTDGTLDTSFDTDGMLTTPIGINLNFINSIAVQLDGKILAGGYGGTTPSNNAFEIVRYNVDGSLDLSFGVGGVASSSFAGGNNQIEEITVQPDGKILAAGNALIGNQDVFAVARFTSAGILDLTFGSSGTSLTQFGGNDGISAIALQPDGKLITAGTTFSGNKFDIALARYETGVPTGIVFPEKQHMHCEVFPNPVSDFFKISYSLIADEYFKLVLTDCSGKIISCIQEPKWEKIGTYEKTIRVPENLASGIYCLMLIGNLQTQVVNIVVSQ